ncbi:DUF6344 domain-containing protein [Streptomyces sp. NPDC059999]|uniref:DUF6344 domain-containing protein n=1 Tax=Streptomyces sp. NPDC059999 TaxID=3347030 RepID=UPI0036C105E3
MAHRSSVTSIWTAVLAALVALFAALGLGAKAAPAAAPFSAPVVPTATVRRPAVMARRTWRAMMRGGSLPPTIKQRIRAEAHGKTPSVRRSTTALAAGNAGTAVSPVDGATPIAPLAPAASVATVAATTSAGTAARGMALAA